jgi:excisionase family DNA binding protein
MIERTSTNGNHALRSVASRPHAMTDDEIETLAELVAERVATARVPRLVDSVTAAALLGVPTSWVLAEARADRIPHVRLGKYVRFEPSTLTAWWEGKAHKA